jgi:VanZ family protein
MTAMRRGSLWGPPLVYCGLIFFLSHQSQLPGTPGGDKLAHIVAYLIMGLLFFRAVDGTTGWSPPRVFVLAAALATLYGVSDEWHQAFVPGRDASLADVLADTIGGLLGSAIAWPMFRRRDPP